MATSDELAQIDMSKEEKDKLVEELMRYMLFKIHQNFDCPIKREEVNCTVTNMPALVINEAKDRLAASFGYEMMEVQGVRVSQSSLFDAGEAKCYVLVSNLDPEVYNDYVEDKGAAHLSAFAFDVISTIHIAGGKMPEEDLWHQLKRVGLNEHDEAHPVLGNNKQLLEYLVQQRYLLKEKFAGPEGHFMMYELAERALDESISGKIKDLISQIRARSTEQHLMEAIKAQLEEVTRLQEEMATRMEAHLQSMEAERQRMDAEWQRIFQFVQILGERTGQPPPPWLFPSQPPATTPDPPSAYSNATVHSRLSEDTSMERAVHGPEYDLSTQDLDGEVFMRAGGGRKHGRCCIGDDTLDTATTPTLSQIRARNTSSSRVIRSWPDTAQHPIEALEAQFKEVRRLREETVARMEANRQSMEADWQMMEAHRQWMEQMFQWLQSVGEKMGQPPPLLLFPSQPPPATTPATIPNQSVASNDGPCHPAKLP